MEKNLVCIYMQSGKNCNCSGRAELARSLGGFISIATNHRIPLFNAFTPKVLYANLADILNTATSLLKVYLACTAIALPVEMNVNGIREVAAEFFRLLLRQRISRNHYDLGKPKANRLVGKSCIPSKADSTLTASLALVSKYGMPPFD